MTPTAAPTVDRPAAERLPPAPQWPKLPPSMWRRRFPLRLSVAIPVIVTALVVVTALCEAFFIGRVLKHASFTPEDAHRLLPLLRTARYVFYLCIGGAVLAAMALSHAVTQPIHRLVEHARKLARHDLEPQHAVRSSDEFSILEAAFNDMATELKVYQEAVERHQRTLEERVQARTEELTAVLNLSKRLLHVLDKERLLNLLTSGLQQVMRYDACGVALLHDGSLEVFVRSLGPASPNMVRAFVTKIHTELAGLTGTAPVPTERVQVTLSEVTEGIVGVRVPEDPTLQSVLLAPLMVGPSVTGLIGLGSLQRGSFDEHAARLLTIIANHAALAAETMRSYNRLQELDRLKSDFISTVSHELRTPLTVVKEGLDLLGAPQMGTLTDRQTEFLAAVRENAQRLYVLINDLLDLSKLESGKMRFRRRPLALHPLAAMALRDITIQAQQRQLACVNEVPETLPLVYADGGKITQVLTNLVGNAVKYGTSPGRIQLQARVTQGVVEMRVWNAGPPLPAAELTRIFDRFYQVGRMPGPGMQGTGLGLSIVREIVQRQGGVVWAESDASGNAFLFALPVFSRQAYLMDSLAELLEQAQLHQARCSIIRIAWDDAPQDAAVTEAGLQAMEHVLRQTLEHQGLADRVLRCGEQSALALLATANAEGADLLAQRAREIVTRQARLSPSPALSHRIAVFPNDGATPAALLQVVGG